MIDYFLLFITIVLVNNCILKKIFNLYNLIEILKKLETSIIIGFIITLVMTLVSVVFWIMDTFILTKLNLVYLRTLSFILIIGIIIQFTAKIIKNIGPILYHSLCIFLPLIIINCTILGMLFINNMNQSHGFLQTIIYSFVVSVCFSLVMVLFCSISERIAEANIPTPFRGISIDLITAGLMFLAFIGLNGLITLS